jgi:hypothetical protein
MCHSFSKFTMRLCGQVYTVDAIGSNDFRGIKERQFCSHGRILHGLAKHSAFIVAAGPLATCLRARLAFPCSWPSAPSVRCLGEFYP